MAIDSYRFHQLSSTETTTNNSFDFQFFWAGIWEIRIVSGLAKDIDVTNAISATPVIITLRVSALQSTLVLRTPRYYGHSLFRSPSIEVWLKMAPGITDSRYSGYYGLSLFRTQNDVPKVSAMTGGWLNSMGWYSLRSRIISFDCKKA